MDTVVLEPQRYLEEFLEDQERVLEKVAESYVSKLEALEVPVQETSWATFVNLSLALLNPYTLVLVAYIAAVAAQLVFVSHSALKGRWSTLTGHTPLTRQARLKARTFAGLTLLGLATTWYNMFAYLFYSYNAYIERINLAGDEITSIPTCGGDFRCALAKGTAYAMRVSQWLADSKLFEEAWLHVVQQPFHWFWSVEVCLYTVGVWVVFTTVQSKRHNVPHLWTYMLLGQSCAISVAQSLFLVALAVRPLPASITRRSSSTAKSDADLMPPPASPAARSRAVTSSPSPTALVVILALSLVGLALVYVVPSSMLLLLAMHAAPFVIILVSSKIYGAPPKTQSDLTKYVRLSTVYALIAIVSLVIRFKSIYDVFITNRPEQILHVLWQHPGQLSISFDAVCITLTTIAQFAFEGDWQGIAFTLATGPSGALAASLAIRERELENGAKSTVSRRSSAANGAAITKSGSTSSVAPIRRRKSTKTATDTEDESVASKNASPSKTTRKATTTKATKSRSKKAAAAATDDDDDDQTTDGGNASEAPSTRTTPAQRAKSSRARPRKIVDAAEGDVTPVSEVSAPSSPTKKPRTRKTSTSSTASAKATTVRRGRPRKAAQ